MFPDLIVCVVKQHDWTLADFDYRKTRDTFLDCVKCSNVCIALVGLTCIINQLINQR